MSSKRGECQRKRPQRHQNSTVFKNDLHDSSDRTKKLNAMNINEVCQKCHDVIEWKIRYRKYKALTKPSTCNRCNQRNVKKAYHVLCRDCAMATKQCAKCLKSEAEVEIIPAGPTEEEKLRLDIEMKHLVKSLTERKRRTFMRFMNGKKKKKSKDDDDLDEEPAAPKKIPTREELLHKIEALKLGTDAEFYDGVADEDDDGSWDTDEDLSSVDDGDHSNVD